MTKNSEGTAEESAAELEPTVTESTFEAGALTPEESARVIDARVEQLNESVIDPEARIAELGIQGQEGQSLATNYKTIADKITGALKHAGDVSKQAIGYGVIGGAMALGSGQTAADEMEIADIEAYVMQFAKSDAAVDHTTFTVKNFADVALGENTEKTGATSPVESLSKPELAHDMEQTEPIEKATLEDIAPRTPREQTPDEIRNAKKAEIAADFASGMQQEDGANKFVTKHRAFIAERFIPGAGIKHGLTGVDAYGAKLSGWERTRSFGEGVLELASFGKSKLVKQLISGISIIRSAKDLRDEPNTSNTAEVIGNVASAIPGARAVKNVAEVVSIATHPEVRAVGGVLMGATLKPTNESSHTATSEKDTAQEDARLEQDTNDTSQKGGAGV